MIATTYTREQTLRDEIAPAVEHSVPGVEVLAVELLSPSRFCVYVDHPCGVDHALCERVTRVLDDYRSEYTIDVSSPGLERPLRKREHFAAAIGQRIAVRADGGKKSRYRGVLSAADDDTITLETGEAAEIRIPYDAIVRANLIDEGSTT